MEYLSPPTTPKKQKINNGDGGWTCTPTRRSLPISSPDRFIPNRAHVDYDYCNSMLSPDHRSVENSRDEARETKQLRKYMSSSILGGSGGKRMIEVFENMGEHEPVLENSFKVGAIDALCTLTQLMICSYYCVASRQWKLWRRLPLAKRRPESSRLPL